VPGGGFAPPSGHAAALRIPGPPASLLPTHPADAGARPEVYPMPGSGADRWGWPGPRTLPGPVPGPQLAGFQFGQNHLGLRASVRDSC